MSLLEVNQVRSGYGKIPVVHGASLAVAEGELVGLVGPNGAGKSTLMKTLMRLLEVTAGSISFGGTDLTEAGPRVAVRLGMGYVPQERNTFSALTVEENLKVPVSGRKRTEASDLRERMYERFPVLKERRRQPASTLSGGERQMLALASAIITAPPFLVLDEPTTGLSPAIVRDLIQHIVGLRREGTAVLWVVEENPLEILRHADRTYIMRNGIIEREVLSTDFLNDEALRDLFFGVESDTHDLSPPGHDRS